ncbi:MAG: trypsin-like peptidase domain-containing protein [Deltaproteobacteria bacterium]|nr:trypsin-like peptidase domain-containing protein [Deltaproteobacteria bacterium]MBI3293149.1 trypsin-like peptidase domain-containing protein [Deltaproteobacteria bacterium]
MRSTPAASYLLALSLVFVSARARAFSPDEKTNIEIYQRCNPAVVNITTVKLTQNFFFEVYPQKGMGSGAIVRNDGYIVTNDHVVGGANKIEVTLNDKSIHSAELIGTDPDSDLAVIRIRPQEKKLSALEFSNSALAVGQKVLAIGNPFGLGGSLSVGIVSSLGRDIRGTNNRTIKDVIQTDAAINPGNSGGPLLDSAGSLIGINAQIFTTSGGSEGIGFAIPVKIVKKIVDELIKFGRVARPWFGVEGIALPAGILANLNIPTDHGVMVTGIYRNSPAARAGMKAADKELVFGFRTLPYGGDVIFQIGDAPINQVSDILDAVAEKKTSEMVTVHYVRNKQKRTVQVKLSLPPNSEGRSHNEL